MFERFLALAAAQPGAAALIEAAPGRSTTRPELFERANKSGRHTAPGETIAVQRNVPSMVRSSMNAAAEAARKGI